MRQATRCKTGNRKLKTAKRGPLVEGMMKKKRRPNGFFNKMSDFELEEYAKQIVKENGIKKAGELRVLDHGLCVALRKRKVLERIGIEVKKRRKRGFFTKIGDEELVDYAQTVVDEKRVRQPSKLYKIDCGLYHVLQDRGLLERIKFAKRNRPIGFFPSMSDEELIEYAQQIVKGKGIKKAKELEKVDAILTIQLRRRGLMGRIGLERKKRPMGFFSKMDDEELIEYAQQIVNERGIKKSKELQRNDSGVYNVLCKRKLIDRVRFEQKQIKRPRDFFTGMKDIELIELARNFINQKDIRTRQKMKDFDSGLYEVLRERKLLDLVFSSFEQSELQAGLAQAADAIEAFGRENP
jgi:hypothetical protein